MNRPKLQTLKPRLQQAAGRVATMQPGSWRTDKSSSTQRGYGYKWQKARGAFLAAHPFCAFCLRDAGIMATSIEAIVLACTERRIALPYASVVDHMDPHRGDMHVFWDSSRWQSLCARHHSSEKQRQEAQG
ncbi:HNH endonuclease [Caballeronia sp. LZ032]|uniref:HNH endonuclease n=1 Tax=Caballeronia sp. LZ032 TaxID=3038565 RepID=UPI002863850B|nr:HNH endonuclease [Caballeronia sp. LZ032]MDR5881110.1 HNH endonuclease [Caballeronia sp. LZ032]